MKLSTKGRYAMIALTDLAAAGSERLVSLSEISERQDISLAYLEQLFVKLRRADIVDSVRGPGGACTAPLSSTIASRRGFRRTCQSMRPAGSA